MISAKSKVQNTIYYNIWIKHSDIQIWSTSKISFVVFMVDSNDFNYSDFVMQSAIIYCSFKFCLCCVLLSDYGYSPEFL